MDRLGCFITLDIKLYGCERGNIKPETVSKRKATMTERYGADQTMKVKELADKVHNTNLNRYGCEHAFQNEEIRNKFICWSAEMDIRYDKIFSIIDIKEENMKKWGEVLPFYKNVQKEGVILWKAA